MSIIATLEGKFTGFKECSTSDYFQAVFNFPEELYGNVFKVEDMKNPKRTNILCASATQPELRKLEVGKKYKLLCSLGVRQPNEKNGRQYPASLGLNIINFQPC